MERKVAFITGASRGIGARSAVALAEAGYDIAITARTLNEGEVHDETAGSLKGSLNSVADEIRSVGRNCLVFQGDLLEPETLYSSLRQTIREWGRIDVLFNQAAFQGEGNQSLMMDLTEEQLMRLFHADTVVPFRLAQIAIPVMLKQNSGLILNMITSSAVMDPPAPAGKGGWGWAYTAVKAALLRMAGVLKVEYAHTSLRFHNVEPGFVLTEIMKARGLLSENANHLATTPETVANVVRWICTDPVAEKWNGELVRAPRMASELGIVEGEDVYKLKKQRELLSVS